MSSVPNTMVLWLYGTPVLDLSPHRGRGQPLARVKGRFRPEALDRWRINDPVLSTSLPLEDGRPDPVVLTRFLDGLLPEGPLREQLARRRGLLTYQVYELLAEYGGDVAGAVSVLSRGQSPDDRAGTYEPLDQDALEAIFEAVPRQPLGNVEADDRISLAGVRAKTLLALLDGTWYRPRHGALSTHVVKVRPHDYPDLCETEPLGMALARATGAGDVAVERVVAGEHVAVAVRRYDRHLVDGRVVRTHQEDALQALGREPHQKYQRDPGQDRGPRLGDIALLLRTYGADLEPLARRTALTALVGDTDAHARNHSLLHDEDGSVRLAPAYDVAPTLHYPGPGRRGLAAMEIGGVASLHEATLDDVVAEAVSWGMTVSHAHGVVTDAARSAGDFLGSGAQEVLEVSEKVVEGLVRRVERLRAGEHPTAQRRRHG